MSKINKRLNFSISCKENLYKNIYLIKMNMNLFIIFLLIIWKKQKMIFYINMNIKK